MVKCIKNPIFISLVIALVISITTNVLLCLFEFPFFIIKVNEINLSNVISFYSTIIAVLTVLITVVLGSSIFYIFTHSKVTMENAVKEQLDNKGQDLVDNSKKLKEIIKKETQIINKTLQLDMAKMQERLIQLVEDLEKYDIISTTRLEDDKNREDKQGE